MQLAPLALTLSLAVGLAACGAHDHDHDHAHDHAHDHDHDHDHGGDHGHAAQHGGLLIELGDHVAHVELVHDATAGSLRLFSMDAHVEGPVRLSAAGIDVVLALGEGDVVLTLEPVASALTGETVGDTSEFAITDPRLVGLPALQGRIPVVETRGQRFEDVVLPGSEAAVEIDGNR